MTLTVELSPEKEALVIAQAQSRGLTAQEWLVQIVEQAAQLPPAEPAEKDDRPLSAMFREIWADMPDEVRAKLPVDGADQHDHYIYGTPKRDQ
jgi:hypothetical protein